MVQKRLLSAFLAAALLGGITSCGSTAVESDTTDGAVSTDTPEIESMFAGIEPEDFGEREFHFLVRAAYEKDYYTEETNGEVYNDAVYERNMAVEEEYNIKIKMITEPGEWEDRMNYSNRIRSAVMAGSGEYDLIDIASSYSPLLLTDKLLLNLHDVEHLRLNEKWWSENIVDSLTVNGKMYYATGDLSTTLWDSLHVIYFNKKLLNEYQLDSPYELVKSGDWTFDAFLGMIENTAVDLNGDTKMTADDRYGAIFWDGGAFENFRVAFGIEITELEDGIPQLNIMTDEMVTAADRVRALIYENENVLYFKHADVVNESVRLFAENKTLFLGGWLNQSHKMRDMNEDFGILPYPKANSEQEGYYGMSRDFRSVLGIPVDVPDASFSGKITEALCVAGHEIIVPVYYEQVLKGKISRDNESEEILGIIRDGISLNFATEYAVSCGEGGYLFRNSVMSNNALATYYAWNESSINSNYESFLECYK